MKAYRDISGLTLFELVLAVAVLSILVSIVVGVGSYALTQTKIRLAESTISVLVTALEQYNDFTGTFPPQCDDLTSLQDELEGSFDGSGTHLNEFTSSEVLYYYLYRILESRKVIDAISESLTTNLDENENNAEDDRKLVFERGEERFSLIRFIDPWGRTLLYEYRPDKNFPKITSAGPDGLFDNRDDIASKGM